jgi:hypothetical protein
VIFCDNLSPHLTTRKHKRVGQRVGSTAAFTHSHCLAMTLALAHEWGADAG